MTAICWGVCACRAPRTGNDVWAREYEQLVPDTWHIINDQVPLPLPVSDKLCPALKPHDPQQSSWLPVKSGTRFAADCLTLGRASLCMHAPVPAQHQSGRDALRTSTARAITCRDGLLSSAAATVS